MILSNTEAASKEMHPKNDGLRHYRPSAPGRGFEARLGQDIMKILK